MADRTPSDRVDVCVVGAGPAGALVADRLADAGHDVVVLEAGPRFDGNGDGTSDVRALSPYVEACREPRNCGGEAAYVPGTLGQGVSVTTGLTAGEPVSMVRWEIPLMTRTWNAD
jgi:choline dehydrogenase-like flavoprotein